MPLNRSELITISETYFESCNNKNWQAVMDTFAEDCVMWFPAATFEYRGKQALGVHFEDFLSTFSTVNFHQYQHISDPVEQSICTYFWVELIQANGERAMMRNCNLFNLNDTGVFEEIIIYNSGALDAGFHAGSE